MAARPVNWRNNTSEIKETVTVWEVTVNGPCGKSTYKPVLLTFVVMPFHISPAREISVWR
jgi:hypothetical protein